MALGLCGRTSWNATCGLVELKTGRGGDAPVAEQPGHVDPGGAETAFSPGPAGVPPGGLSSAHALAPHTCLTKAPLAVLDGVPGAPGLKAPAPLQAHSGEIRPSTEHSCFALTYPPGWQCGAKVSFYLLVSVSVRGTVNTFSPLLTEPFGSVGPSGRGGS